MVPYNDIKKTKSILDQNRREISCLIIEPIQGSLPNKNIKDYLIFLKKYCDKNNINIIFDEMITGLRTDFSCVQKNFGVNSDITLFGKCFGAGFPIGIIALNEKTYKKLKKLKTRVFFGGTFFRNSIISFIGNEMFNF